MPHDLGTPVPAPLGRMADLLGTALLYLIPAKFAFFSKYQMLLFGLALVVMVIYRPEGLIPDRKRQSEFHDEVHEECHEEAVAP